MKNHGGKKIVEVLKKEGVKKIFGVPGESYLNVLDALYDEDEIEYVSARQEGGASFMSEGYAKAIGDVGVCMATRGPGATNLSIGLHTAQQDSTPLVALIGQVERPFREREAFQEVDFVSYFRDLVKWTVEINDADRIPELLHRAFHVARSGRPGPVLVSLPEDMQDDEVTTDTHGPLRVGSIQPDDESVKQVAEALAHAKKPVIIAGGGIILSNASQELVELSERLQIPVATAFRRFHAFPNSHPNYIGSLGLGGREELVEFIKESDLVLAIGTKFSQITTVNYTLLNPGTCLIHVDICPDNLGKVYTPSVPIVSNAKQFIKALLKIVEPNEGADRQKRLQKENDRFKVFSTPKLKDEKGDYADMRNIIHQLSEQLPNRSIVTSDAGNFFSWLARYFRYDNETIYIGPTSGAMGYGMPSAIGAKAAHPDRIVVSLSGDGGYMMTMQEFETAVRCNIPIITIVVNNNLYGTIRNHQEKKFPHRAIATTLTNPSYAKIAKDFGGNGTTITNSKQFTTAIKDAIQSKQPTLIEVMTDPTILSAGQQASQST